MFNFTQISPKANLKIRKFVDLLKIDLDTFLLSIRDKNVATVLLDRGTDYETILIEDTDVPFHEEKTMHKGQLPNREYIAIETSMIDDIINNHDQIYYYDYFEYKIYDKLIRRYYNYYNDEFNNLISCLGIDDVYISIESLKKYAPDIVAIFSENPFEENLASSFPFFDKTYAYYSEELAIAVETWLALYGDGGKYKTGIPHKKQIEDMITGKGLSNAAIERISTLINPQKKGGAPASGY